MGGMEGTERTPEELSVVMLQTFYPAALPPATSRGDRQPLPYRVETIADAGIALELTDRMYRGVWQWPPVRRSVWTLERWFAPFLQTLLMARSIGTSDATIAMFEREAYAMGFRHAAVGALVRSSYHADKQVDLSLLKSN